MLEDIKNKINDNAKEIGKELNNSASAVTGMAKDKVDSVALKIATQIVISSMNGIASKGFSYINNDKKYQSIIDKTWEMLPLPMRLVGKETLNYENNMYFLRKTIFGKDKEEPKVDIEDEGIISRTIKKMFS
tara:strand:+ start:926 stop:1321 length:396 start_codon:yes stop_codon:yes gene_type:complete